MRVVISAPRKSGGPQLRCLLSMAYELKPPPLSAPTGADQRAIAAWLSELPDKGVITCDLPVSSLVSPASDPEVHLFGVIRHPFDLFISNFDVAQQWATRGREEGETDHAWSVLAGEDLEGMIAQQYAATEFAAEMKTLGDWFTSGRAVRYEDLIAEPAAVLASLAPTLGVLTAEQIDHAVGLCPPENVVLSRPGRGRRMPSVPPGAWRERLPATLQETLRARYGAEVSALGYDAS